MKRTDGVRNSSCDVVRTRIRLETECIALLAGESEIAYVRRPYSCGHQ